MGFWSDLTKEYLPTILKWYKARPLWLQISIGIIIMSVLLVLARAGVLGDPSQRFARLITPKYIAWLDDPRETIRIDFTFDVESEHGRKSGNIGGTYYTGNHIYLLFETNVPCYLLVFNMDAKGINLLYPPLNASKPERFVPGDSPIEMGPFQLDEITGTEVFYLVASYREFEYKKDIASAVNEIREKLSQAKGVDLFGTLNLADDIHQKSIYFQHKNKL